MLITLKLVGGLALLLIGGEAIVRGAAQVATRFGLSRLIVGMVIAGFGTSLPELVVSVRAVIAEAPGLAVGNVIGSNIANILLILALAALISPIAAARRHLEPEGFVLIAVSIVVLLMGLQGTLPRWQGAVLLITLFGLVGFRLHQEQDAERRRRATADVVETVAPLAGGGWPALLFITVGLIALPIGGELFVDGAVEIATLLGISKALIGLTIVAVGTSLPELATTVVAAVRGEATIGYGNVVGSNIFNLLGIFGAATLVGTMQVPLQLVYIDGLVMLAATAMMFRFLLSHARLSRIEAAIMLASYAAYVVGRYAYSLSA
jgi:cation:H+ antiporter